MKTTKKHIKKVQPQRNPSHPGKEVTTTPVSLGCIPTGNPPDRD